MSGTVIGQARIQIPFKQYGIFIDVVFSILEENALSLLSNMDMIDNGLDISLQGRYVYIGRHRQPLTLKIYFFVYR